MCDPFSPQIRAPPFKHLLEGVYHDRSTPSIWTRYIAIDIHKHYLMIGGIDAHKRIVLQPRRVELHRWSDWAQANLHAY